VLGYMGYRAVRSVYRADQQRAATPKPYALPPLWASLFVIPFVLLMAFLPSHGGVVAFLLFPLILGVILLGGFIAFQCKLVSAKSKPVSAKRYARPASRPLGNPPPPRTVTVQAPSPADFSDRSEYLKALEHRNEEAERVARTLKLYEIACPQKGCEASPLHSCKAVSNIPVVLVDKARKWYCHFDRMQDAVRYGFADREDITAQFDGSLPEGLEL
jgi:hypothetical protein